MSKFVNFLLESGLTVKDGVRQGVECHYEQEIADAKARQKRTDISSAVKAFIELKVSDVDMYKLLQKYFGVGSIAEAEEFIKKAKISSQIIKLREHLSEQGMTNSEFRRYADDNHLEKKLNDNIKLLDLSAEKLKLAVEK